MPLSTPHLLQEKSLLPQQQFKSGISGASKQNLALDASVLSGSLDVPLKARRFKAGTAAFLRVERRAPDTLRILNLRGDPLLRSVIFESLHKPEVHAQILRLLEALQENTLGLTLQTLSTPGQRSQDEMDFSWIGRRLIIRKSAPPESQLRGGAIALPDEYAKRAVIQDRLDFERFQQSVAYRSVIQNYDIPRS